MGRIILMLMNLGLIACGKTNHQSEQESIKLIMAVDSQTLIFKNLLTVINHDIPDKALSDSVAFLILPVHASCPACRDKTIDSIVKHRDNLPEDRYIIISANGGRKTINSFFRDRGKELPDMKGSLFLDSTNKGYQYALYEKNPEIYYAYNRKVYKKITAIPQTVKRNLKEFFSGHDEKYKTAN